MVFSYYIPTTGTLSDMNTTILRYSSTKLTRGYQTVGTYAHTHKHTTSEDIGKICYIILCCLSLTWPFNKLLLCICAAVTFLETVQTHIQTSVTKPSEDYGKVKENIQQEVFRDRGVVLR